MGEITDIKFRGYTGKDEYDEEEYIKIKETYPDVERDYAEYVKNLQRIEEINTKLSSLADERQRNTDRLDTIDTRIRDIDTRLTTKFNEKEKANLNTEKERLVAEIDSLIARNTAIDTEISTLDNEKAALQAEIETLKTKHGWR